MQMMKFTEMKLIATGDASTDEALLEWLYLAILAPMSFGYSQKKGEKA